MKQQTIVCLLLALALLLSACAAAPKTDEASAGGETATSRETAAPQAADIPEETPLPPPVSLSLRIVDGAGTEELVLAGDTAEAVYTLSTEALPVRLDGEEADASVLEDGMMATVWLAGPEAPASGVLDGVECFSVGSLGTPENPGGSTYDLCGFYLQVLDDLWEVDSGLNGGITYLSVDLSQAPGNLTDGEKAAVARIFAEAHNAQPLTLTYEELEAQGYLTEEAIPGSDEGQTYCHWEDGLLFSITPHEEEAGTAYSLPVLRFDAQKWRTPLGAYYFHDCTAVWPEMGTWSDYNVGAEMIS